MTTLDIYEAADFLKMHWQTLRKKVKSGEIPAAKLSKSWVFIEADLVKLIQSKYSSSCSPRSQVQQTGEIPCCTNDKNRDSGGVSSPHQTESEYNDLLKP